VAEAEAKSFKLECGYGEKVEFIRIWRRDQNQLTPMTSTKRMGD
jgi:hypothetical protein